MRSPRPASDLVGRCEELRTVLPADAVFSHATAWRLWDADPPRGLDRPDALHVLVPEPHAPPRRPGAVGHRTCAPIEVVRRYRLPVPTVETVWTQLAAQLEVAELVVAGDALVRRRFPLCTPDRLRAVVEALPRGARGAARLRAAIGQLRAGTDSCMETRLRLLLLSAGLPSPAVNRPVLDRGGRIVARADLSYASARIAVEYDGDIHRVDRATWQRDIARRRALDALGWRTITWTAEDLRHPESALSALRHALVESARMQTS
jgi:hypothetical protein